MASAPIHNEGDSIPYLQDTTSANQPARYGSDPVYPPPPLLPVGSWWQLPSLSTEKLVHFQDDQSHPPEFPHPPQQHHIGTWGQFPSLSTEEIAQQQEDQTFSQNTIDMPSFQQPSWWGMYPPPPPPSWWLPPPWWLHSPAQPMNTDSLPSQQEYPLQGSHFTDQLHSSQPTLDDHPMEYQYSPGESQNYYEQEPFTSGQYGWWPASPWQSQAAGINDYQREHEATVSQSPLQPNVDDERLTHHIVHEEQSSLSSDPKEGVSSRCYCMYKRASVS